MQDLPITHIDNDDYLAWQSLVPRRLWNLDRQEIAKTFDAMGRSKRAAWEIMCQIFQSVKEGKGRTLPKIINVESSDEIISNFITAAYEVQLTVVSSKIKFIGFHDNRIHDDFAEKEEDKWIWKFVDEHLDYYSSLTFPQGLFNFW